MTGPFVKTVGHLVQGNTAKLIPRIVEGQPVEGLGTAIVRQQGRVKVQGAARKDLAYIARMRRMNRR